MHGLLNIHTTAGVLYKSTKKAEELKTSIDALRKMANNAELIKAIKANVREEVKIIVNGKLGEKTKVNYESLYDKDIFEFNQLTTGHAANPDIKTEINLYLKAGEYQVPMAPYSNAGRMRALILSFAFALLEKSSGTLNFLVLDDPTLSLDDEHKARFVDNLVDPFVKGGQVVLGTHYERFFKDSESVFNDGIKLSMVPRKRASDQVVFEAGDLLDKVEEALAAQTGHWKEEGGNLRVWIERSLCTLSGYCPEPFTVFNDISQSITNYSKIVDPGIATKERDLIINVLQGKHVMKGIIHKLHHDEPVNEPDVRDAFKALKKIGKIIRSEISRLKELHNHALHHRHIHAGNNIVMKITHLTNQDVNKNIIVLREAAAAHNGQGLDWDINEEYSLAEHSIIQVCSDVISPIAQCGQYVLLGSTEMEPNDDDLVAFEAPDQIKYLRKFWKEDDGTIILEGMNPTKSFKPIHINSGRCNIRKIVGVLYKQDEPSCNDAEWSLRGFANSWFNDIVGVRVKGTSLEPVARNGQIILIKKQDIKDAIKDDMLACISIKEIGDVIKRCHVKGSQLILSAVNPNEREVPIVTGLESIQQAYELKGVLFEHGVGKSMN